MATDVVHCGLVGCSCDPPEPDAKYSFFDFNCPNCIEAKKRAYDRISLEADEREKYAILRSKPYEVWKP